jgi:hypothetical protein
MLALPVYKVLPASPPDPRRPFAVRETTQVTPPRPRLLDRVRAALAQDVDFATNQIVVRGGKGDRDRVTMLPAIAKADLTAHLEAMRSSTSKTCPRGRAGSSCRPPYSGSTRTPVGSGSGNGLVANFARPGGNLTGFALGLYEEKGLEILKEALPGVRRVAYPAPAGVPRERFAPLNAAARALGVEIQGIPVQGPNDFDAFFAAARRAGAGAVLVRNIAWFRPHLERIGAASAKSRLPAIGYDRQFAESGGLLSYGPAPFQNVPRLAAQIDKILKGAKPADLPVEQPTKYDLVINLKTAKALGITIPQSIRFRADMVIE